ncbi:MAG: hypothetical protein M1477_01110 [Candidatus Thermoplasmatota archaeon]|jgi:DNA mismatch repair ATPase MutS|nr:hypothetical protein [Candidatus Thermoplasmatota archaeon]
MNKRKFDEELNRTNLIVDHLTSGRLACFNESFAATSSIEGFEVAKQIMDALIIKKLRYFSATHKCEHAATHYDQKENWMLFMRAHEIDIESQSFNIIGGKSLPTSYGEDLYISIFY